MATNTKSVTRGAGQELPSAVCLYDGQNDSVVVPASGSQLPASLGQKTSAGSVSVVGASDATFAISAASLPLPTGASTAAKQPALGTAGTPSADYISVQNAAATPMFVSGPIANLSTSATNPFSIAARYNSTLPTYTNTQLGELQLEPRGGLYVVLKDNNGTGVSRVLPASAGFSPQAGLVTTSQNLRFNGSTFDHERKANATSRILSSAASTNATSAKASAGDVHKIFMRNTTGAILYFKAYNKASAPTVGTDTPIWTVEIPANGLLDLSFPNGGYYFSTGIAFALTGAQADADTTALNAGDVTGLHVLYS